MPTPRLEPGHPTWELAESVHKRHYEGRERIGDIAKDLGKNWKTIERWIVAVERYQNAAPGQLAAIEATGLDLARARHGWRIIQHEDGSRDSVFWKADDTDPQDVLDAIRAALEDIPAVDPAPVPEDANSDLPSMQPQERRLLLRLSQHRWMRTI